MIPDAIAHKAAELTRGCPDDASRSEKINAFIRDRVLYYLDDWDTPASTVLRRMRGMCSGKVALSVAMHRSLGIPARYRLLKLSPREGMLSFVTRRLGDPAYKPGYRRDLRRRIIESTGRLPPWRDHLAVEVLLANEWQEFEISRDQGLEAGMRSLSIWHERREIAGEVSLENIDDWLKERMARRSITADRRKVFRVLNREMDNIRQAGRFALDHRVVGPEMSEVEEYLSRWRLPGSTAGFLARFGLSLESPSLEAICAAFPGRLSRSPDSGGKASLETACVAWLYELVRANVKRGRSFLLGDVLKTGQADCLGYVTLFQVLGRQFGLDVGPVEVIVDRAGRAVPHLVNLVRLADRGRRYVDFWYGSTDVSHKRLGLCVKENGAWRTGDFDADQVSRFEDVRGLPPECLSATKFYVLANGFLKDRKLDAAVRCYDISTWLYPANSRPYFNRAIAYELQGKEELAQKDYRSALRDRGSRLRVMASIEELEPLIELDRAELSEAEQRLYLLKKGFI